MNEKRRVVDDFQVGNGGWLRYRAAGLRVHLYLRFEERAGRLVPVDLVLVSQDGAPQPLDTDVLRSLPLGMLEAVANSDLRAPIAARLRMPAPDVRSAVAAQSLYVNPRKFKPESTWVQHMLVSQAPEWTGAKPKPPKFEPLPRTAEVEVEEVDANVNLPKSRPYGEGFYRRVAEVYGELVKRGMPPASAMADANGVPATTAHRWVKEARRRELLGPGRQGKAG